MESKMVMKQVLIAAVANVILVHYRECTDPNAHNYDPIANVDDGSCETCSDGVQNGDETDIDCGGSKCAPCNVVIQGCTDPGAHNYNPQANEDDGSCETCTDGVQNGDESDVDCGGSLCAPCNTTILGCTDPSAHNYNPQANQDDGSCETCSDGNQNGDETDIDCGEPCVTLVRYQDVPILMRTITIRKPIKTMEVVRPAMTAFRMAMKLMLIAVAVNVHLVMEYVPTQ